MRRYRKSTGRESMRASRAKANTSLIQMQNAGTAMGMMAASGVRQGSLVQRAQMQSGSQKPRFTSGQARNAGVAMGMMAATGRSPMRSASDIIRKQDTCSCRDGSDCYGMLTIYPNGTMTKDCSCCDWN